MSCIHDPFDLLVPFLRPEEEDSVLLNGSADAVSVVVPAELVFRGPRAASLEDSIKRIELIVAAEIVDVAVKIIASRLRDDADLASGRQTKLRTIAVPFDSELFN